MTADSDAPQKPQGEEQPRQRDRAATENALLEAASEIFSAKGYESATTKEIASQAGCAEALIHRYFKSKEGLLLELIKRRKDEQLFRDIELLPMKATMYEEAEQIIRNRISHLHGACSMVRIVLRRVMLDPSFRKEFESIGGRQKVLKAIEKRCLAYQEAGKMRRDISAETAAEMLSSISFHLGFVRKEVFCVGDEGLDLLIDSFAKMFAEGVSA